MIAFDAWADDTGERVVIFATGERHAFQLFCEHHESVHGAMPGHCHIQRRALRREPRRALLRKALDQGRTGVGVLGDHGWTIYSITPITMQLDHAETETVRSTTSALQGEP